jgi:hypothetical protein
MKSILSSIIILVFSFIGMAQEPSPAQKLLSSKGNINVSKRFREAPVLPIENPESEIYRITFIPTFYHPINIRVEKHWDSYILVAKRLSGQGGYDAGHLKIEKRRKLKQVEWEQLAELLNKANFWQLPFEEKEPEPNEKGEVTICLDGSEWTLEGVRGGKYHAVNRYCPEDKSFEAVGLYLAKISGLKINERELY